jgi:hypothetical protein
VVEMAVPLSLSPVALVKVPPKFVLPSESSQLHALSEFLALVESRFFPEIGEYHDDWRFGLERVREVGI